MKILGMFTIASFLLFATVCAADNHEADKGLEGSLRAVLNERHVHVNVHDGIVTLDGKVPTEADRQRIDSLVRDTAGVVAVKDNLKVTLPSPGVLGAQPSTVPVYATPPPVVATPAPVVTVPTPVIIPQYPKLKVQPWSSDDVLAAKRIARQLQEDDVPSAGLENVTIMVRDGTVSLQGTAGSTAHDAIIASIQHVSGLTAIYDQLQRD